MFMPFKRIYSLLWAVEWFSMISSGWRGVKSMFKSVFNIVFIDGLIASASSLSLSYKNYRSIMIDDCY